MYFVNQRKYRTVVLQMHALTRMRNSYSLKKIISHQTIQVSSGLCLRMCQRFTVYRLPRLCTCNGQPSSKLFCVHCRHKWSFPVIQVPIFKVFKTYHKDCSSDCIPKAILERKILKESSSSVLSKAALKTRSY
jgi:hypothetical protein